MRVLARVEAFRDALPTSQGWHVALVSALVSLPAFSTRLTFLAPFSVIAKGCPGPCTTNDDCYDGEFCTSGYVDCGFNLCYRYCESCAQSSSTKRSVFEEAVVDFARERKRQLGRYNQRTEFAKW